MPRVVADSGPGPRLTDSLSDTTTVDHAAVMLTLTISRINTSGTASGLAFTLAMPSGMYIFNDFIVSNTCGGSLSAATGATSAILSAGSLANTVASCTVALPIASTASGSYDITSDLVSGVSGMANDITTRTVTVTPRLAELSTSFAPDTISVLGTSTLSLVLTRSDTNLTAAQASLSYTVTLPVGLVLTTGSRTNSCGGTLTATATTAVITLAGGSIAVSTTSCTVTVPVDPGDATTYVVGPDTMSSMTGVQPDYTGCEGLAGRIRPHTPPTCGGTLTVTKLSQTITFPQPGHVPLTDGTATLTVSSTSGLTVALTSTTLSVCTVSGHTVTLVTSGTCTIEANQAGNGTYHAATAVTRSFAVTIRAQPPTGVTATAGVASITADWSAPGDTTGITGYRATASPGPATCTTASASATSCVLGGTAGVTYTVTVVALSPDDGDSAAAGPSNEATPTGPPVPGAPPATGLTLTTDQGLINTVTPGQHLVVIGTGFAGWSTAVIVIYSAPVVLGTVVTDGHGDFSTPVTVPPALAAGHHTVVASGVDPRGRPHYLHMGVVVGQEDGDDDGELPRTGTDVASLLLAGGVLTLTGIVLRWGGTRRPRRRWRYRAVK